MRHESRKITVISKSGDSFRIHLFLLFYINNYQNYFQNDRFSGPAFRKEYCIFEEWRRFHI